MPHLPGMGFGFPMFVMGEATYRAMEPKQGLTNDEFLLTEE